MAPRGFRHALADIPEALGGMERAVAGKAIADYSADWLLKHGIEIIPEASRALPEHVKAERPEIPWQKVRAIGNVLRHDCHGLSDALIRRVVVDELPPLRAAIAALRRRWGSPPETTRGRSRSCGSGPEPPLRDRHWSRSRGSDPSV